MDFLKIDDPLERSFYEKEAEAEHWGVRELKRQMKSMLFQRIALSTDKESVMRLAYGARPEKVEPFTLLPGQSYEELKNFWNYDYTIVFDEEKKENIMHIFNYKTGEEIGYL